MGPSWIWKHMIYRLFIITAAELCFGLESPQAVIPIEGSSQVASNGDFLEPIEKISTTGFHSFSSNCDPGSFAASSSASTRQDSLAQIELESIAVEQPPLIERDREIPIEHNSIDRDSPSPLHQFNPGEPSNNHLELHSLGKSDTSTGGSSDESHGTTCPICLDNLSGNDEKVLNGQARESDDSSWNRILDPENPIRESNSAGTPSGSIGNDGSVTQLSKTFQLPQDGKMPNCQHIFHKGCLDDWLKIQLNCPICRSSLKPMSPSPSILAPTSLPSRLQGQESALVASRDEMTAVESLCDTCATYATLLLGGPLFVVVFFAVIYLSSIIMKLGGYHHN